MQKENDKKLYISVSNISCNKNVFCSLENIYAKFHKMWDKNLLWLKCEMKITHTNKHNYYTHNKNEEWEKIKMKKLWYKNI